MGREDDDVWSETYEEDVERLQRIERSLGVGFALAAIGLFAAVVALLWFGVPALIELLFAGVGDD